MTCITRFIKDYTGATATEYSIMLALIAAVIIDALPLFGKQVKELFVHANTEMADHGI